MKIYLIVDIYKHPTYGQLFEIIGKAYTTKEDRTEELAKIIPKGTITLLEFEL